jgi:hypothetical protein
MDIIVEEANRYAEQSTARAWKPVTDREIYVVLGLFMLMGIV